MSTPKRIQLSRAKGWRKPEGAIVVSRPSRWGNPFSIGSNAFVWPMQQLVQGRETAVFLYENWLYRGEGWTERYTAAELRWIPPTLDSIRADLAGRDLACWCPLVEQGKYDPCHAAVLLKLANGGAS